MKVYYGKCLADLKTFAPNAKIFEDTFVNFTAYLYADCWNAILDSNEDYICKTKDAIYSCPVSVFYRVGRSAKTSNQGEIICTEVTKEFLERVKGGFL